jgi:hypothetical protein
MTISTTTSPTKIQKWYDEWRNEQIVKRHILDDFSPVLLTTWYAEQVVKGEIIACKKVIQACFRHLNDLKRQGTDDFPYVFNEELGHRPIGFIEKYCKPSKGDYEKLILQPWQHFAIGSLYGWVHKDTGVRRFREGLIFIGRKNGKTTKISGLSLFSVSKDREEGARVYVLANTKQQAGELFDESRVMVRKSPSLRKRFRENQKGIFYAKTFSQIEPRASDSEKLDGLNTHLGIFDEIHEFKDFKLINVIKRSWSARKQPMVIYITTAGYQLDGPLMEYYEIAKFFIRLPIFLPKILSDFFGRWNCHVFSHSFPAGGTPLNLKKRCAQRTKGPRRSQTAPRLKIRGRGACVRIFVSVCAPRPKDASEGP